MFTVYIENKKNNIMSISLIKRIANILSDTILQEINYTSLQFLAFYSY